MMTSTGDPGGRRRGRFGLPPRWLRTLLLSSLLALPASLSPKVLAPRAIADEAAGGSECESGAVVEGYLQVRWTAWEQVENGLRQPVTWEDAADVSSGFSLHRVRLSGAWRRGALHARISIRLENSPVTLSDAYGHLPLGGQRAVLYLGQMKIPATYEIGTSSRGLDLLSRSELSGRLADLALCRSPALSSPRFNGARAYLRDAGVGLKGMLEMGALGGLDYFLMVGNGLGANRFIGGDEKRQEIYANEVGAYFYGLRLELQPSRYEDGLRIGGHYSYNHHPNLLLDDKRTVLDLERRSFSADVRLTVLERLRLTAMYGGGVVADDFDHDGKDDYRYSGWELKAILRIRAGFEAGLRVDTFFDEYYENGREARLLSITAGVNWRPNPHLRLQANYKHKDLDSEVNPELDDDSVIVQVMLPGWGPDE